MPGVVCVSVCLSVCLAVCLSVSNFTLSSVALCTLLNSLFFV